MRNERQNHWHYERVEKAIVYLQDHFKEQPGLDEVASHVNMSAFHFQRLFRQWAGVSPKRFLQFLTADYARRLLRESRSVLETSYEAGLSGPGRLHDLLVSVQAATPGEIKSGGEGIEITYGVQETPFGQSFLASTSRGVCALYFTDPGAEDGAFARLRGEWPKASLRENGAKTAKLMRRIMTPQRESASGPLPLLLKGTNFQLQVWQALLRIPPGKSLCYGDIAQMIGSPRATRAVGSAIGRNPIAFVIPCHRVLRATGEIGGYHWGPTRKTAILAWEGVRQMAKESPRLAAIE